MQGTFHYVIIDFLAGLVDRSHNAPRHGGDVSDARWIALDQFSDYALVDGLKAILRNSTTLSLTGQFGGLTDPIGNLSDFMAFPCFPDPGP
jgi:hypothetical protein